jgi:hypothetical protein
VAQGPPGSTIRGAYAAQPKRPALSKAVRVLAGSHAAAGGGRETTDP